MELIRIFHLVEKVGFEEPSKRFKNIQIVHEWKHFKAPLRMLKLSSEKC